MDLFKTLGYCLDPQNANLDLKDLNEKYEVQEISKLAVKIKQAIQENN